MDGAPVSCGYKDAIEDFDEAISKHPECRAAYYNRGAARQKLRETNEAI